RPRARRSSRERPRRRQPWSSAKRHMRECPMCGSDVPAESRYCPECGRPLASDATVVRAPSAWWPPDPFLLVVLLVAVGGIILLVAGPWWAGLVALLVAAVAASVRHGRDRLDAGRTISIAR